MGRKVWPRSIQELLLSLCWSLRLFFIFIALNNPQASFPWSNEITYILYGVYVCLMIVLFIAPFKRKSNLHFIGLSTTDLT